MGTRTSEQAPIWIPTTDLPVSPGHPFYARLNTILDEAGFDRFAEEQCRPFYAPAMGVLAVQKNSGVDTISQLKSVGSQRFPVTVNHWP